MIGESVENYGIFKVLIFNSCLLKLGNDRPRCWKKGGIRIGKLISCTTRCCLLNSILILSWLCGAACSSWSAALRKTTWKKGGIRIGKLISCTARCCLLNSILILSCFCGAACSSWSAALRKTTWKGNLYNVFFWSRWLLKSFSCCAVKVIYGLIWAELLTFL